jgi:CheY-like chemotaxis protein
VIDVAVVLVVDDSQSVRKSLMRLLEAHGHAVLGAGDGAAAIQTALQEQPAVIIMDLYMPVLSGIEAARRIREHPQLRGIPIIGLSASTTDVDDDTLTADGRELPFTTLLTKPCAAPDLLQAIAALLQVRESEQGRL